MGFFNKLKDFFSEQEDLDPKVKKLSLKDLESWLCSQSEAAFDNANGKIKSLRAEIAQEKNQLSINLSTLEQTELKNTEIPARVKQIMQGNRETYIQRMSMLSDQINVPLEFVGLLHFTNEFEKKLANFEKSIAKNHHIMLEFFVREATAISSVIKNIDKKVKEIKQTMSANNIFKLERLKQKTKDLQKKIKEKSDIEKKIKNTEEELNKKEGEIENKENKVESLKSSEEYQRFVSLTEEKEKVSLELQNLHSRLIHSFSEIETALKKYANSRPEDKLTKCYLDDPIKTLLEDKTLDISKILKKVRNSVEINEIELKEKKKDKTIRELEKLSEYYFKHFLRKQKELTKNVATISKEINSSTINKDIRKLKDEIKQSQTNLAEDRIPLKKLKKDFDEMELDPLKDELENGVLATLNKQIKIV